MTKKEKAIFQRYRERVSMEYRAFLKAKEAPEGALLASREKWQASADASATARAARRRSSINPSSVSSRRPRQSAVRKNAIRCRSSSSR